jgi:hypothetical protein
MSDIPEFRKQPFDRVHKFMAEVLTNPQAGPKSCLRQLKVDKTTHQYRALFDPAYFALSTDRPAPTKSQWTTLRKRMKRHRSDVFIFKGHGTTMFQGKECYYLNFGFFVD